MSNARALLSTLWTAGQERLRRRLDGITEEEFGWEPVAGCWALRQSPTAPGGFQIDYDWPTPIPPPFTTIAWRLVHLANGNRIRWEYAVGPARRNFLDLEVPGGADDLLAYWRASCQPISDWLARATDAELAVETRTLYGEAITVGETVRLLLDEQIHHGAEIGVLRDLFARRQ